ncbi:zf-TFIIB domain-containing protein [Cysteiniphilum sp. JM-1]|uniref:TFIIB-type zinc ribbon-containing protein n=1 Tax=Cysteiniphilum sp. JM-1 TaxID=2610891 RepID=UPI0012445649|nr:zf-TFIIB domain-containing protein [Cysteiniphilum sp. JM-1]
MNCPTCTNEKLLMTHRDNVEIDYCPSCRGIWLDRGELDKIIERNSAHIARTYRPNDDQHNEKDRKRYDHEFEGSNAHNTHKKKKKSSFLGELFDF